MYSKSKRITELPPIKKLFKTNTGNKVYWWQTHSTCNIFCSWCSVLCSLEHTVHRSGENPYIAMAALMRCRGNVCYQVD